MVEPLRSSAVCKKLFSVAQQLQTLFLSYKRFCTFSSLSWHLTHVFDPSTKESADQPPRLVNDA